MRLQKLSLAHRLLPRVIDSSELSVLYCQFRASTIRFVLYLPFGRRGVPAVRDEISWYEFRQVYLS